MTESAVVAHPEAQRLNEALNTVRDEVQKVVVGQKTLVDRILLGLVSGGHILLEGVPGLAKTTTIKAVADAVDASFSRIQFTPDLLPADVLGTEIYRPNDGSFAKKKGPIFGNLILADEINRAPAKVQSALLEAMQERQVTLGDETFNLQKPFLVLATQNPIEQEGTYRLPEAQVDRFMLKISVDYPSREEEREIMKRYTQGKPRPINAVLSQADLLLAQEAVETVYIDDRVEGYIVDLVFATRDPASAGLEHLKGLIELGASPRASIALAKAAKVMAFMSGRAFVVPQDIKTVGKDILRHRIQLSYEAEAQELSSDEILEDIFGRVDVP